MATVNENELWKVRGNHSIFFYSMNFLFQLISTSPIYNNITIYGTFMCPEYDIYHTRYPQDHKAFKSDENIQFILLTDLKVRYYSLF